MAKANKKEMRIRKQMPVKGRDGLYYFDDPHNEECPECGPYKTRQDCTDDRNGMARTYASEPWLMEQGSG